MKREEMLAVGCAGALGFLVGAVVPSELVALVAAGPVVALVALVVAREAP